MSRFSDALAQKDFLVTVELDPPRGVDLGALKELGQALAGRVDALVVSDHRAASPRQSPWWAAHRLIEHGAEVVMTVNCRDRNRLALTGDMLAAASARVANLLIVSGDHPILGDHPAARGVYDLDSVQALQLAAGLNQGHDLAGNELSDAPAFCLGSGVAMAARPLAPQIMKLQKKRQAGASFLIGLPLKDLAELETFAAEASGLEIRFLAGVEAADPSGRQAAAELCRAVRASGLAGGVHLSMPAAQSELPALLDACGL